MSLIPIPQWSDRFGRPLWAPSVGGFNTIVGGYFSPVFSPGVWLGPGTISSTGPLAPVNYTGFPLLGPTFVPSHFMW
jgi:hypothetical protein